MCIRDRYIDSQVGPSWPLRQIGSKDAPVLAEKVPSSLDVYKRQDDLSYDETKQCVESFVFGVNTPSRWGTQAPFSNITLDWVCPADLRDQPAIVGGKEQDLSLIHICHGHALGCAS